MADPRDTYAIGVDVGTGSARACIIDFTGELFAEVSKPIKTWNLKTNFYEQSTNDIWASICYSVKGVLEKSKIPPEKVKGVGFDATCSLAVMSSSRNQPVSVSGPEFTDHERNVILWMDHRCPEETDLINSTNHRLLKYVGGKMSIEMEIPKVLWLKKNMPKEVFEDCKFYDLVDALTHIATGTETRSYCSTVCKQGFVPVGVDGSVKGWQDDFLNAIGLPELVEENFRRIGGVPSQGTDGTWASAGEYVGSLSVAAAADLGLIPGTKVGSGVIDAYAGWVGTVGAKVRLPSDLLVDDVPKDALEQAFTRLAAVAGTSTCHLVMSKDPIFVPGVWGPYRDVILPKYWMAEGGQSSTGSLLNHVLTAHPAHVTSVAKAEAKGISIFELLNARLEEMKIEQDAPSIGYLARHYFFYGDHHGNRSPIADPNMRGSVVGVSMDISVDDLTINYYAAMEFIAQQTRHILTALNSSGHSITSIFMSGGQCRNAVLMQLIANATKLPVIIPRYIEAAVVLGSAMLGAKASTVDGKGQTEDLWTIMDKMSKPGVIVNPTSDPYELGLLEAKYQVFLEMASSQQKYRNAVNQAVAGWK